MPHTGARSAAGGNPEELCTFSPAINPASERLLEDSATVPSGERTGAMGSAGGLPNACRGRLLGRRPATVSGVLAAPCATPPIAPPQKPAPPFSWADFQERLRYYSLRKQLKQRAAVAAAGAEACTFRPDTGNAVQVLALSAARAGQVLESEQVGRRVGNWFGASSPLVKAGSAVHQHCSGCLKAQYAAPCSLAVQ